MTALVLYYSDTGNTQTVAKALAERLGAELGEVTCQTYLTWYGPLAMAWDIFTRHRPKVTVLAPKDVRYDLVVIGGPVWGARAAPPVLSAIEMLPEAGATAVFVTCRGTSPASPPEPALVEMEAAAPAPIVASQIFREEEIHGSKLERRVSKFAGVLQAAVLA
jgi:flavodoxin